MENQIIDTRGLVERTVKHVQEQLKKQNFADFLSEYQRYEKTFQKENNEKSQKLKDQIDFQKQNINSYVDNLEQKFMDQQKKIQKLELQSYQNEQDIQFIKELNNPKNLSIIHNQSQQSQSSQQMNFEEIAQLKDYMTSEMQKREKMLFDQLNKISKDQQENFQFFQSQIHQKFLQTQENLAIEGKDAKEQFNQMETMKIEKVFQENNYMKNIISQLQKRIDTEVDKRLRQEYENKTFIDQKISVFQDQMKNDEKEIIKSEKQIVESIGESVRGMTQIIKLNKEELEANILKIQTIFTENSKTLSKTLELTKENLYQRIDLLEKSNQNLLLQVNDSKKVISDHLYYVSQSFEQKSKESQLQFQEIQRNIQYQHDEIKATIQTNEHQQINWQEQSENKSFQLFTEMKNSIKICRSDIIKERQENENKLHLFKQENKQFFDMTKKLNENQYEFYKHTNQQLDFKISEVEKLNKSDIEFFKSQINEKFVAVQEKIILQTKQEGDSKLEQFIEKANLLIKKSFNNDKEQMKQQFSKQQHDMVEKFKEFLKQNEEIQKQNRNDILEKFHLFQEQVQGSLTIKDDKHKQLQQNLQILEQNYQEFLKQQDLKLTELLQKKIQFSEQKIENRVNSSFQELRLQLDLQKVQFEEAADKSSNYFTQQLNKDRNLLVSLFKEESQREKNERIAQDKELATILENTKNIILEQVHQKSESQKSLFKTLLQQEQLERQTQFDQFVISVRESLELQKQNFKNLLESKIEELKFQMNKQIQKIESLVNEFKTFILKEVNSLQNNYEIMKNTLENELYLQSLYQKLKDDEFIQLQSNLQYHFNEFQQNLDKQNHSIENLKKHQAEIINKIKDHIKLINNHKNETDNQFYLQNTYQKLQENQLLQFQQNISNEFSETLKLIAGLNQDLITQEKHLDKNKLEQANSLIQLEKIFNKNLQNLQIEIDSKHYLQLQVIEKLKAEEFKDNFHAVEKAINDIKDIISTTQQFNNDSILQILQQNKEFEQQQNLKMEQIQANEHDTMDKAALASLTVNQLEHDNKLFIEQQNIKVQTLKETDQENSQKITKLLEDDKIFKEQLAKDQENFQKNFTDQILNQVGQQIDKQKQTKSKNNENDKIIENDDQKNTSQQNQNGHFSQI